MWIDVASKSCVSRMQWDVNNFKDAVQLGGQTDLYLPCEVWIYSLSRVRWNVAVRSGCKLATSFSALDNNPLSKGPWIWNALTIFSTRALSPEGWALAEKRSWSSWALSWMRIAGKGAEVVATAGKGISNVWPLCSASDSNPGLLGGASTSESSSEIICVEWTYRGKFAKNIPRTS